MTMQTLACRGDKEKGKKITHTMHAFRLHTFIHRLYPRIAIRVPTREHLELDTVIIHGQFNEVTNVESKIMKKRF